MSLSRILPILNKILATILRAPALLKKQEIFRMIILVLFSRRKICHELNISSVKNNCKKFK